jgi:hypothetical protein
MITRFAASLRTDNCPQPKEAQPRSHTLSHPTNTTFGLLGSWFGPEVALNWLFPYPILPTGGGVLRYGYAEFAVPSAAAKAKKLGTLMDKNDGRAMRVDDCHIHDIAGLFTTTLFVDQLPRTMQAQAPGIPALRQEGIRSMHGA